VCTFDVDLREPLKPAREVPVALAEQLHARRHEHRAHDRGVDDHRHAEAEAHLLEHREIAEREPANADTTISAAPVMIEPVERSPWSTAWRLSPVWS
jgi:hypothetical protein